MSKTDEEVEPYTVTQVERRGDIKYRIDPKTYILKECQPGLFRFCVYYRNYIRLNHITVDAKDELEAYILGQARITRTKTIHDRRKAKKEQTK